MGWEKSEALQDPAQPDKPRGPAQPSDDDAASHGPALHKVWLWLKVKAEVTVKMGLERVVVEVGEAGWLVWEAKEALEALCGVPAASQLLYGPDGLLGDLDVLRPADHLLLRPSPRLSGGGGVKKTRNERRADKPKAPKRPASAKGGPPTKGKRGKKEEARGERRLCRDAEMEAMWAALQAGKADPGPRADALTPNQARAALTVYRGILNAAAAQVRKTPGKSLTDEDRAEMLSRIETAREMIRVEGQLLGKRGKDDIVTLRKQQEIVAGLVQEVMIRGLIAMTDHNKVTISDLSLQFLYTTVIEQTLLLKLHDGQENVTYTEAEGDKCFELAAQYVADSPVALRSRDLRSVLREARSALVAAPHAASAIGPNSTTVPDSTNGPASTTVPASTTTPMDTGEQAANAAPDESEPMVTDVHIGDEEPIPLETAQQRVWRQQEELVARRREERRRAFVTDALAYLHKELDGKTLSEVEGWFTFLLTWYRHGMGLPALKELRQSQDQYTGMGDPEDKPAQPLEGELLFTETDQPRLSIPGPCGLHNPGTLCYLAPAFVILCEHLSVGDLLQPTPEAPVDGDVEPMPEAQPAKVSEAAVVVAALRAHIAAAKGPSVEAINLFGLGLALVGYKPRTFGDPSGLELDWSDALLSLLSAIAEVFPVSPVRHLLLARRSFHCPPPRPPFAYCQTACAFDAQPVHTINLLAVLEPKEIKLAAPLELVPLLEKVAQVTKKWTQGCCWQVPDGHDRNGKPQTKPLTTGNITDTVTELPPMLIVKLGRQMGEEAADGLCTRPLVVGGAVVDLSKAVHDPNSSGEPLLYAAKHLVLKKGNQSGHYVTVSASAPADGRVYLIDDAEVSEARGELDDWAKVFRGLDSFFVDCVVLENVDAAAARAAASTPSVPRLPLPKPYVLHPSPEFRKAGGIMALVKTGAVRDVLGDDDPATQKAANLGLVELDGPVREGYKLVGRPERVDPDRNSLVTLSHAPGERLVAEKLPLDSRLLSPLPYEAPARPRRTPLYKARRQLHLDDPANHTTEATAEDAAEATTKDTTKATTEDAAEATTKDTTKATTEATTEDAAEDAAGDAAEDAAGDAE